MRIQPPFFSLYFLFALLSAFPQIQRAGSESDSLIKVLTGNIHDTVRIKALNDLSWIYYLDGKYPQGEERAKEAMALCNQSGKIGVKFRDVSLGQAYNNLGVIYESMGRFSDAVEQYEFSLAVRKRVGDKKGMAASYNNLGGIYRLKGDFDKALDFHLSSLKIKEELGDKKGMGTSYNNIGNIYHQMHDFSKALQFHLKSLAIKEELGNRKGMADSYISLGLIQKERGELDKALEFYLKGVLIYEESGNLQRMAIAYNNIGNLLYSKADYPGSMEYHFKSMEIRKKLEDLNGISASCFNIGNTYFKLGNIIKSKELHIEAMGYARRSNSKTDLMAIFKALASCDSALGNYRSAFEYIKLFSRTKDSVFNEESARKTAELQTLFESEKKDKELILKDTQILKQNSEAEKRDVQRNILIGGLVFSLISGLLITREYRSKSKANAVIKKQKEEVEKQNQIIEEKTKGITDSINYALKIQKAILPDETEFKSLFPDSFVLFMPKDIVSGDFYWVSQKGNYRFWVTADCTGHGVPGGFMSMLGNSLLNEIVNEKGLDDPADIMDLLRLKIIYSLKQRGEAGETRDGMDMSVCRYDTSSGILSFASANSQVWLYRKGVIQKLPFNRQPVGISAGEVIQFSGNGINISRGDIIYTFSDGFQDQFGGPKGKKFKQKSLERVFSEIATLSMTDQERRLKKIFFEWKGELEQIDDVLVIGNRFS
jgi:tetratricopeptide (TPR) repeat protein